MDWSLIGGDGNDDEQVAIVGMKSLANRKKVIVHINNNNNHHGNNNNHGTNDDNNNHGTNDDNDSIGQQQQPLNNKKITETNIINKRIQWFVSPGMSDKQIEFLLNNINIVDGIYTCCGGNTFYTNGSLSLPIFNLTKLQPFMERNVRIMSTFGGAYLPLAAWENREALAEQILHWVVENNLTGVHNDWETHGDPGVDAYKFYDFWKVVGTKFHEKDKQLGICIETAPANISHPWVPRTPNNDTRWHSYLFNWDYPLGLDTFDVVTNMATYPMMHTTDGNNDWCAKGFPNTTWCTNGCEDFVDHLTPAFRFLEQVECDVNRHTVAQWCGLKGHVQDMIDAGTKTNNGQLSPGIWMNNCAKTAEFPTGITAQGWTQSSFQSFLTYLDKVGVRSIDMWTSNLSDNDLDTCDWFLPELEKWHDSARYSR